MDVGGPDVWDTVLDDEQQARIQQAACTTLCRELGEKVFEKLSVEEQRTADFYVWAGCCMHKELNSVKGATNAMTSFWGSRSITGPRKLLNKDNLAAVMAGTSEASARTLDVSIGGVIKLTSLAGVLFNHKDDKKGHGN